MLLVAPTLEWRIGCGAELQSSTVFRSSRATFVAAERRGIHRDRRSVGSGILCPHPTRFTARANLCAIVPAKRDLPQELDSLALDVRALRPSVENQSGLSSRHPGPYPLRCTGVSRFKGLVLLNALNFCVERFGESGWSRVLGVMTKDERAIVESVVHVGWYDTTACTRTSIVGKATTRSWCRSAAGA